MLSPPWRLAIAPPIIVNVRCCVGSLGRGRSFGARGLIALACLTVLVPSTARSASRYAPWRLIMSKPTGPVISTIKSARCAGAKTSSEKARGAAKGIPSSATTCPLTPLTTTGKMRFVTALIRRNLTRSPICTYALEKRRGRNYPCTHRETRSAYLCNLR